MFKKIAVIAIVVTILMLVVRPVGAITFGEPDGIRHPNVGVTLTALGDDTLWLGCLGTLIAFNVLLMAGHCTTGLSQFEMTSIWITFDSTYNPQSPTLIPVAGFGTHAGYNPNTLANDVGVKDHIQPYHLI